MVKRKGVLNSAGRHTGTLSVLSHPHELIFGRGREQDFLTSWLRKKRVTVKRMQICFDIEWEHDVRLFDDLHGTPQTGDRQTHFAIIGLLAADARRRVKSH